MEIKWRGELSKIPRHPLLHYSLTPPGPEGDGSLTDFRCAFSQLVPIINSRQYGTLSWQSSGLTTGPLQGAGQVLVRGGCSVLRLRYDTTSLRVIVYACCRYWKTCADLCKGGFVVGSSTRTATLYCKSNGVLAGVPFFDEVFAQCGCAVE